MNNAFSSSGDQRRLLLPHVPSLFLEHSERGFSLATLPPWIADLAGISPEEIPQGNEISFLEKLVPGLLELAQRIFVSRQEVDRYQTTLFDHRGFEHQISIDGRPETAKDGREGVAINIQAVSTPSSKEHLERQNQPFFGLIGKSAAMMKVFNKIRQYGQVDAPVLILGETGSGKEGIAAALHQMSRRSRAQFVPVNCNAISENLFESELFGHEKGAFTGAIKAHKGRFERAHQGTLFLDEIGDLPLSLQTKLLRVIETSIIERVGSEQSIKVDVRLVAATNKHLEEEIAKQTFRADLFYRLNALQIFLPPLRDRAEDVPLLVNHFIDQLNLKYGRQVVCLSPEAIHLLKQYRWPGNVRELRNLIERLFAENQTEVIGIKALREWYDERMNAAKTLGYNPKVTTLPYREVIPLGMDASNGRPRSSAGEPHEKPLINAETIKQAFRDARGNMTRAASLLGIHKATLYRHLKSLNLDRDSMRLL